MAGHDEDPHDLRVRRATQDVWERIYAPRYARPANVIDMRKPGEIWTMRDTPGQRRIYIIGSMRNPGVVSLTLALEAHGHEVFSDWYSPGPEADTYWQEYEQARGRTFKDALAGPHAENVFNFDVKWLTWADTVVLVSPAGKSAHLELGWAIGQGKEGYVLLDGEPERYDVMYRFATAVCNNEDELLAALEEG